MNAQLVRYNSQYWEPGTEAMDTITCSWADDNNWLCPPIYLIPRVLKNSRAKGTLVVPKWLSSPFWPLLFPDGTNPAWFVQDCIELPRSHTLFLPGRSGSNLFHGISNTLVLALHMNFGQ